MQLQGTRYVHSGRHETEKWVPEEAQDPVGLQMAGLPAASGQSAAWVTISFGGLWWGYETQPTAPNIYFAIRTKLHMRPAAPSAVLAPPV